jgi:steroid 5-alpha reductase family enzyme
VGLAYLLAFVAALAVVALTNQSPLPAAFYADIAATLVVFGFSVVFRNSSFYDAYWSVAPPVLAGYWWISGTIDAQDLRMAFIMLIIGVWAVRLTGNWAYGWRGLGHADWRYVRLREQTGVFYWVVSLLGIHLFPTIIVFLGCLPIYVASRSDAALNLLDVIGLIVGTGAIWIETSADAALHRFRDSRASSAEVLDTGIWGWCRHPNYLGEIGVWVAVALFGVAAGGEGWMVWAGPVAMVALFAGISIPMIETKLMQDKPGYAAYRARVAMLVPFARLPLRSKV